MKLYYLGLIFIVSYFCKAQSSYQFGILPSLNINKKLPYDFKLNLELESRQELKSGPFNMPADFNFEYELTDFSVLVSKKIAINKSLALGYLARISDGKLSGRTIQQYIATTRYSGFILSHRFSADQTFTQDEDTEYRLRYRLSSEIPLNGQSVDPKEFYINLSNEYLNSLQEDIYDLEIRVGPFLGYKFMDTKKLEFGLDYRINSFIKNSPGHRFWIGINWYHAI